MQTKNMIINVIENKKTEIKKAEERLVNGSFKTVDQNLKAFFKAENSNRTLKR